MRKIAFGLGSVALLAGLALSVAACDNHDDDVLVPVPVTSTSWSPSPKPGRTVVSVSPSVSVSVSVKPTDLHRDDVPNDGGV